MLAYKRGRREEIKLGKRKEGVNGQVHHTEREERKINMGKCLMPLQLQILLLSIVCVP